MEVLLRAGASVQLKNMTGEAPLYIAALRGHSAMVQLLLRACKAQGAPWLEPHW